MGVLAPPGADEMIVNIRNMLNQPQATNSFWTDEELLVYMNEGIRRYFTEVLQTYQGEFTTSVTLDLTENQEAIPLPADFFMIRSVARSVTNGYIMLAFQNNLTADWYTNASGGTAYLPTYYFRQNSLILRPVPGFSETAALSIEYVYFPATLLSGGDSLTADVSPIFRDLIEMYAVYKAKLKESLVNGSNTYSAADDNVQRLAQGMRDALARRSMNPTFVSQFAPEVY